MDALPGSKLYAGLKRGFDRAALEREIARGTTHLCLHVIEPNTGDCVFIPAGTIHALGAGLLVAEIQQASDTTYRLFDWNRVGADGRPRQLHVQRGLDAIDFDRGPVRCQQGRQLADGHERLVECDKFVLDRHRVSQHLRMGGDDRFHILAVLGGAVMIPLDPSGTPLSTGETVLLPASAGSVDVHPTGKTVLLDMFLP
jgi:mannose-6-phosphate isomerase